MAAGDKSGRQDDPQLSRLWECVEVSNQSDDAVAGEEKQALGNEGQWETWPRT